MTTRKKNSVEVLFDELQQIDFKRNPFRGLISDLAREEGYTEHGRVVVRREIFEYKNVALATKLKMKVNALNSEAARAL